MNTLRRSAPDRLHSAGTSIIEALLLIGFSALFVVMGLNIFSDGVTRSYCKASVGIAVADQGGGTDEVSGGGGQAVRPKPSTRRPGMTNSQILIESCVAVARGPG